MNKEWVNKQGMWYNAKRKLNMRFEGTTLVLEGSDTSSFLQSQIRIENFDLKQFKDGLAFGLRLPYNRLAELAYYRDATTHIASLASAANNLISAMSAFDASSSASSVLNESSHSQPILLVSSVI